MSQKKQQTGQEWVHEQIGLYQQVSSRYAACAETLQQVLTKAAKMHGISVIIQTRPKAIASFAEKIQRKKHKYRDPLLRLTDLCGGRVITQTQDELKLMCEFIVENFELDRANSVTVEQRLKPSEFGYRSIHYIVQFKPGVFPSEDIPVEIPAQVYPSEDCPMKAEIQVRSILEHAWATFTHDRIYKGAFSIPDKWQRELAILAGMLEGVDQSFTRIQDGLHKYAANYGAYMTEEDMRAEIEILETALECDEQNAALACRIGKLAMSLGDWRKAVEVFSKFVDTGYQPVLRDLGVALCKVNANHPTGKEYRQGQRYLEMASAPVYRDVDALASLAGTWKKIDPVKTLQAYRQAYELDPTDPYAVSNFLVYEIIHRRDLSAVQHMGPAIRAAMQRCRDQAAVEMNLPWAYYNIAIFDLLLGRPDASLGAYAKAIQISPNSWMIETSLRLLEQLEFAKGELPGFESAQRLLLLGWQVKFPDFQLLERIQALAAPGADYGTGPVVIIAGGCDAGVEQQMQGYRQLLLEAFKGYRGDIISGGTRAGVSGLVGDIQQACPEEVRSVGYLPEGAVVDGRYHTVRHTTGKDFSALEAVQYWTDLIACGVPPSDVKLIGINGGDIAGAEYRMALALGARVALVERSGRAMDELGLDVDWKDAERLIILPGDAVTLRTFIGSVSDGLVPGARDTIAQAIHDAYLEERIFRKAEHDSSLAEWDQLLANLKESNRLQADHILDKLQRIGCTVCTAEGEPQEFAFSEQEVEIMAEMEHSRWLVERLQDGWRWGEERSVPGRVSPHLKPWHDLPDDIREWDRRTVRRIPEFLARAGLEIHRGNIESG
ncbi:MAG: hypothetical protein JXA13_01980 [Anaerolineales bacterium]|nr:hypothetical protein [Anaerolineales bacterium]